ncbi:MAG TPA: DinB family protein [Terriglobales bacterium]|nr:DinB family protein [Terriglobales bacterium]
MNMHEYFQRLFSYDGWANGQVVAAIRASNDRPARSVKLLAHIFAAERLWLERLKHEKQSVAVWPEFTLADCEAQAQELPQLWKQHLQGEGDLAGTIIYKNTKGENWTSRRGDILQHVVMHSAYHRGQIAADMRAAGFTPAYTDFIHGVRQGFVE